METGWKKMSWGSGMEVGEQFWVFLGGGWSGSQARLRGSAGLFTRYKALDAIRIDTEGVGTRFAVADVADAIGLPPFLYGLEFVGTGFRSIHHSYNLEVFWELTSRLGTVNSEALAELICYRNNEDGILDPEDWC